MKYKTLFAGALTLLLGLASCGGNNTAKLESQMNVDESGQLLRGESTPVLDAAFDQYLSAIQKDFLCSEHQLGWVASIYFIVSVMFLLPSAKLADIFGKKRVFLSGAVIALLGVILCIFSQNIVAIVFVISLFLSLVLPRKMDLVQ